uniref:Uncharacterized protein n=1 Tax=Anguilla anguilla TaxID=7936 RepID=A0A0E9VLS7_ANGAN
MTAQAHFSKKLRGGVYSC